MNISKWVHADLARWNHEYSLWKEIVFNVCDLRDVYLSDCLTSPKKDQDKEQVWVSQRERETELELKLYLVLILFQVLY